VNQPLQQAIQNGLAEKTARETQREKRKLAALDAYRKAVEQWISTEVLDEIRKATARGRSSFLLLKSPQGDIVLSAKEIPLLAQTEYFEAFVAPRLAKIGLQVQAVEKGFSVSWEVSREQR
jgi:hypothetical protein